jgi:hypothetical protein
MVKHPTLQYTGIYMNFDIGFATLWLNRHPQSTNLHRKFKIVPLQKNATK